MGGEQKPVHHRLGRGGKKPIVIIGTVVGFFVVLSMTGLGHSHNHVERDMPAHAALSGRGARRHRPEADHFARARAGGGLHGAHGLRDRYRAHDSATHRVGSGDRHERAHDVSFGNAIDDAIETTAKTWMHEVVDPIVDTLHDSAQHGGRGGAGARHHGRGADDASFSETSLLAGAERAAEAAGGLAHLTHAARDAAHLDRDTDGLLNDVSESSFSRFGDADDPAAKLAELKSGLNPARARATAPSTRGSSGIPLPEASTIPHTRTIPPRCTVPAWSPATATRLAPDARVTTNDARMRMRTS